MNPFSKTRWSEFYTTGTSANGSASIDKARMPSETRQEYQAREYLAQALKLLDSRQADLRDIRQIQNLLSSASSQLGGT